MKKIISLALALFILVGALLVLGLAIESTLGTIYNLYRAIDYAGLSLKGIHSCYCAYSSYSYGHVGSAYEIVRFNLLYGYDILKNPILCLLADTAYGIATLACQYTFAVILVGLALMLIAKKESQMKKISKLITSIGLALFGLAQLVMGFVKTCAWIRTMISLFRLRDGFLEFFKWVCRSGHFHIYSVIYYVVALGAILGAACLIFDEIKSTVKAPKAEEAVQPIASEAPVESEI